MKRISMEEGLSQSVVTCIMQDSRGFMWFGTQDGLNKYDGYEFTTYRVDNTYQWSISGNYIRCLYEDRAGNLWIGTDQHGLNKYDREKDHFFKYRHDENDLESISDNRILSITESPGGQLYIGTQNGLNIYDRIEVLFDIFPLPDSITPVIKDLLFDHRGRFWIGTDEGIVRTNTQNGQTVVFQHSNDSTSLSSNEVHCIRESRDSSIMIGTRQGLNFYVELNSRFITYYYNDIFSDYLEKSEVQDIIEDESGNLWVGTFGGGLIRTNLKGDAKYYLNDPDNIASLSNDYIISLFIDQAGLLWIGTYGGCINKLEILEVEFNYLKMDKDKATTLPSNEIYSILYDSRGNLWTGTDMGLCRYEPDTDICLNFNHDKLDSHSISNDIVYCMLEDRNHNLWFGTDGGGLNRLDPDISGNNFQKFQYNSNNRDQSSSNISEPIYCIEDDNHGNIWAGTANGLIVLSHQGETLNTFVNDPAKHSSISGNEIFCILEDTTGTIWVGTDNGLNKYNKESNSFTRFPCLVDNKEEQINPAIYCLYRDKTNKLWFGTDNEGLFWFNIDDGSFYNYTTKDGLPDNVIYAIIEDKEHNLWMSTNNGLSKAIRHSGSDKLTFINYNTRNWLQTNIFNIGAHFQNKDGRIFFGGSDGIVFFDPEKIRNNKHIPEVVITDFRLFYETVEISGSGESPLKKHISETKRITLKHSQNVISFEFASLNYIQNEKNLYAYMLEGFDKDWRYIQNERSATWTNLDPGEYVFRVKASNSDGLWNEEGTTIEISVKPPFTSTIWFYILLAGTILLIFWGIIYIRTTSLQKQKNRLEQDVVQRTTQLSETNIDLEMEIMERKKIETELKYKNVELSSLLDNLKKTQSQLIDSEKMASLGQLTAGVAHEINNPINFVSGNVTPLKRDIDDILKILNEYERIIKEKQLTDQFQSIEDLKEEVDYLFLIREIDNLIKGINEGAKRTTEIVKGLRNFSRLDENESKSADIHEGIDSALLILKNRLKQNIEVVKDYGNIPGVLCFPGQLNQVFMNILNNAIQAINGEGKIRIKTSMEGSFVRISIKDSGKGMTPEVQKRIFEPFFTTKDVGKGTGLGLSISYGIIEKHNGKISVKSEIGKGTEFIIKLPSNKKTK